MKEALRNLFKPAATVTMYATVKQRLSPASYEVEDQSGRIFYVESNDFYPVGVAVRIENGRIVGPGNRSGTHRVYEV